MIHLSGIKKTFYAGRQNEVTVLHEVDLSLESRAVTVLKGPSGSGKTTLLGIIGCMARPTAGRIRLKDNEITSLPERFLAEIRRKTFGFVFQKFNLISGISVAENVMLPAYPLGLGHRAMKARVAELLRLFSIEEKASSPVEFLSGGEMQRVATARALMNDPEIIIADEPTANLDSDHSREFMEIVLMLREMGKMIIIASHDPIVFDARMVDSVVEMRDGRITGRHDT